LELLRADSPIRITMAKNYVGHLEKQRCLLGKYGFQHEKDARENDVPAEVFVRYSF
jgi:hypothetical protein